MASDQERSGTPDLGNVYSLVGGPPTSASQVSGFENSLPSFINDLQYEPQQNDWGFSNHQLEGWSPGLDTFDAQFFTTPNANIPLAATDFLGAATGTGTGTGTLTPPLGIHATDVNQELAEITAGFNAGSDSFVHGSSESPVGLDERLRIPPKIGTRFSKESLRILRNWLSTHGRRPFPTEEERRLLQHQTGLTKTQILNWLANARRRGKIPDYQSSSPRVGSASTSPIGIPRRAATPVPQTGASHLDPLQRWVDSPPEHEPATAAAIARAVASSPPAGKILNFARGIAFLHQIKTNKHCLS